MKLVKNTWACLGECTEGCMGYCSNVALIDQHFSDVMSKNLRRVAPTWLKFRVLNFISGLTVAPEPAEADVFQ